MEAMKAMQVMMANQMEMQRQMQMQMMAQMQKLMEGNVSSVPATPTTPQFSTPVLPKKGGDLEDDAQKGSAPPPKKLRRSPRNKPSPSPRHNKPAVAKKEPSSKKVETVGQLKRTLSWAKARSQGKRTPKEPQVHIYVDSV